MSERKSEKEKEVRERKRQRERVREKEYTFLITAVKYSNLIGQIMLSLLQHRFYSNSSFTLRMHKHRKSLTL